MFQENVARGIEALDLHGPVDWRSRLDLDRLDITNTRWCVLGQVFGDFFSHEADQFMEALGGRLESRDVVYLGFDVWQADMVNAGRLTATWVEALSA